MRVLEFLIRALCLPLVLSQSVGDRPRPLTCTVNTALKRKEWGGLTRIEKLAYINGIKCLKQLPSRFPPGVVPAAENFLDDFTAVHINQSLSIHISGIFLSWHRHYLHLLEVALHDHCNYPAGLGIPYWQWTKYSARPWLRAPYSTVVRRHSAAMASQIRTGSRTGSRQVSSSLTGQAVYV